MVNLSQTSPKDSIRCLERSLQEIKPIDASEKITYSFSFDP
jgi:hypothetical protein